MKNFLNKDEIILLTAQHRKERDRKVADRIKAVLLYNKYWSYKEISEALLLDDETIRRHIKDYRDNQKLKNNTGGSECKLSRELSAELVRYLEKTTYTKVEPICSHVKEKYGINYTISGMTKWLHNNGFSYKKPKKTPAKADSKAQEKFKEFYQKLKAKTPDNEPFLFTDATHPTMATLTSYGWIKKGTDKLIPTTASRTRLNLVGSINLKNMEIIVESYKTINSDSIVQFFNEIKKKYPKAPRIHIILDQGSYHKSKQTIDAANQYDIILHFLPTYSPNLNPIERLWKVMNEFSRNNCFFSNPKEFRDSIFKFFNQIWPTIRLSMKSRINDNFQSVINPLFSKSSFSS
jgi:transposase